MRWFHFFGTAAAVLVGGREPDLACLSVEIVHAAGFILGDSVLGHDFFDGEVGFEVGFDEGPEGGGEGARHVR